MMEILRARKNFCILFISEVFFLLLLYADCPANTITATGLKPENATSINAFHTITYMHRSPGLVTKVLFSGYDKNNDQEKKDYPPFKIRIRRDIGNAVKTTASDFKNIYTSPARINTRYALWLGGILYVGGIIYAYDQDIYDAIHRNKDHRLYKHFRHLGEACEDIGYMGFTNKILFGLLTLGYIGKIEPLVTISTDLLESYIVASPNKIVKSLMGRRGPGDEMGARSYKRGDGRSFPSGHSMNIMQLADVLSHHFDYKPFTVTAYVIASSVLLQRVTSDHHWPSDVYTGAVFGWVISHHLQKLKSKRRMNLSPLTSFESGGAGLMLSVGF